jgi:ferredoxin
MEADTRMATIYCFSSTGNSLYAARRIALAIGGELVSMAGDEALATCHDDVVGLVFPCYFWGVPRLVGRFIERLEVTSQGAYVFVVLCSGGPIFGALGQAKELLAARGIRLGYGRRLASISNYLPEFMPQDSEPLRKKVDARLARIIADLKARKTNSVLPFTPINRRIYQLFPDGDCDRLFTVSDDCQGCATCEGVCPVGNIELSDTRPQFRHHCEHCLGCLHNCPSQAIDWDGKTEGKARYRNARITVKDLTELNRG